MTDEEKEKHAVNDETRRKGGVSPKWSEGEE
jgi:hypothetical protein